MFKELEKLLKENTIEIENLIRKITTLDIKSKLLSEIMDLKEEPTRQGIIDLINNLK